MINNIDNTTTPHLSPALPALPALATPESSDSAEAAPQPAKKNYSIHVPLVVSTTDPVFLSGDPHDIIQLIVERMKYTINVLMPDGQEVPMYAAPCVAERCHEYLTIPVVLCCHVGAARNINDIERFSTGLIDTINEAIAQYGCTISHIQPQIMLNAQQSESLEF